MPQAANPQRNPTGTPIIARVLRTTPAGLVVVLSDGREGLVRERDLGWEAESRQGWTERYSPGVTVQVFPLGKGRDRRPELSVRLAQSDSWHEIKKRYPAGSLVEGVVTGVMPYGAFVEVEPGISGLLHISHYPASVHGRVGEVFWPGDRVMVIIGQVNIERKRIALTMEDLLAYRWRNALSPDSVPGSRPNKQSTVGNRTRLTVDMLFDRPRTLVLVVEDEEAQRKSVADWLRFAGQEAEVAGSAEEALEMVGHLQPDIVLMDIGLGGMDGIQAAQKIMNDWPGMRCVLMTDWGRAERRATELHGLREAGVALLIKPLLPEDLLSVLLDKPSIALSALSSPSPMSPSHSTLEQSRPARAEAEQRGLESLVQRLQAITRADKVVLFELDVEGRQIKALEQRGAASLRAHVLSELIHSPVRDVAEEGVIVLARNATEVAEKRFVHLTPLLDFKACLGVPIPAQLQRSYALFLFFAHASGLTDSTTVRAEGAAAAIGAWLERQQMLKQAADFNRIAVLGQLGRALVHEISGRLTPVNLALQRLQAGCDRVEQCAAASPEQVIEEARLARAEMENLLRQAEALAKTTRSFSRMTRQGQEEIVVLDEIIAEALDVLSDTAATAGVKIALLPSQRVFFTRTQVTHLQQVLVNVLQNAIQQVRLARPKTGGRIEIRLAQTIRDGVSMVQVSIEDDGPGIHRRLWKRVFDMDYTTRAEGSGLGLYLSRSLIEAQGGRIIVRDSRVLWGSTFVVELPYRM
jgi:signal transduction histidine kinase/predicted RNA-binding protein with RPS1 domain/ActR/RegA family two-component response regulator